MQTVTIRVNNAEAMRLLEDLVALDLIEMVSSVAEPASGKKLSERLAGSITSDQAAQMREELIKMRGEWDRDI